MRRRRNSASSSGGLRTSPSYEKYLSHLMATGGLRQLSVNGLWLGSVVYSGNNTTEKQNFNNNNNIKQVDEDEDPSWGFDVVDGGTIVEAPWQANYNVYKSYVEFAIKYVKSNVQFVRILKANWQAASPMIMSPGANYYYITFEAYDDIADDDLRRTKIYQTRLILQLPFENSFVDIFRPKPPAADPPQFLYQQEDPSVFYESMEYEMV